MTGWYPEGWNPEAFDRWLTTQPDPEDDICTTCDLPYSNRTDSTGCEEHAEFWADQPGGPEPIPGREPLYVIECCEGTEIPIFTDRDSVCPVCRSRFTVTTATEE